MMSKIYNLGYIWQMIGALFGGMYISQEISDGVSKVDALSNIFQIYAIASGFIFLCYLFVSR